MIIAPTNIRMGPGAPPSVGPHAYFNALVARPDHWKSYSLRDQAQLLLHKNSNTFAPAVTYLPSMDSDPHKQDAAKIVVPPFEPFSRGTLAAAVSATDTIFTMPVWSGAFIVGRGVLIDAEFVIVTAVNATARQITVTRGARGTTPAPHGVNAKLICNVNSLLNQVRVPLNAPSGYTYLLTWDAYWTDSFLRCGIPNHKAWQISTSASDQFWLESQTRYGGAYAHGAQPTSPYASIVGDFNPTTDIAALTARTYGAVGPSVVKSDPILPMGPGFIVKPNTWTRYWVQLTLAATGYDSMSYWVADETRGPVPLYVNVPLSVGSLTKFWIEFNTSTDTWTRSTIRDLVAYVRNVVVLRNPVTLPVFERPQ